MQPQLPGKPTGLQSQMASLAGLVGWWCWQLAGLCTSRETFFLWQGAKSHSGFSKNQCSKLCVGPASTLACYIPGLGDSKGRLIAQLKAERDGHLSSVMTQSRQVKRDWKPCFGR